MTETSPAATVGALKQGWADLSRDAQLDHLVKQGRPAFPIELRALDDNDAICPRDGVTPGRLQVRGPWVIGQYFGMSEPCIDAEGWFDTGDVAVIHPDGTMQITDRSKDVIKSGGEWISSVDLENCAVGCPGVAEAAAIAVAHPQWVERPLLLVVRKQGANIGEAEIRAHLAENCARWWQPDEIHFVDELPHTATGKLLKTALRDRYKDYRLATA
jgi:fatty-acyl-CoA synthase